MARIRRHSRHQKTKRGKGLLHLLLLGGCGLLVIAILTWNLEDSKAVKWMTSGESGVQSQELGIYPQGQFGYRLGTGSPMWVATTVSLDHNLIRANDTIFHERAHGQQYTMVTTPDQGHLWKELTRQQMTWLTDKDSMEVVYGSMADNAIFVAHKLGQQFMAIRLPADFSRLPLNHFMMSIQELEEGLDFELFRDVVEDTEQLSSWEDDYWPLDTTHYYHRMNSYDTYEEDQ